MLLDVVVVETLVEGVVHNPGGETDAMGVVSVTTSSSVIEKAQVATEQLGAQSPPPPFSIYQAVKKVFEPAVELSPTFRLNSRVPLAFHHKNSYLCVVLEPSTQYLYSDAS